jgi:hypothetical protein
MNATVAANLALILFAPWFAILGWAYWTYPRTHARTPARRRYDVVVLLAALVLSALAMRYAFFNPAKATGSLWPQVAATLAAYHVFLAVVVVAWFARGRLYRARCAPGDGDPD